MYTKLHFLVIGFIFLCWVQSNPERVFYYCCWDLKEQYGSLDNLDISIDEFLWSGYPAIFNSLKYFCKKHITFFSFLQLYTQTPLSNHPCLDPLSFIRSFTVIMTYTDALHWFWSPPTSMVGCLRVAMPWPLATKSNVRDFPTFRSSIEE